MLIIEQKKRSKIWSKDLVYEKKTFRLFSYRPGYRLMSCLGPNLFFFFLDLVKVFSEFKTSNIKPKKCRLLFNLLYLLKLELYLKYI